MTSSLLTSHLHQQRERIAGMLMPGAKITLGQRPISSLLRDFGGRKFQIAARVMRSLDPARLGNLRPDRILRPLITPLGDARDLLHFKPASEGGSTAWNEVETVFPSLFGESETAPQPGELRQGSIIPRMATFPKPGQSIESFKEQVERRPKKPAFPIEYPQPPLPAQARLFSHVQEIRSEKKPPDQEAGPVTSEKIQPPPDLEQMPGEEIPEKEVELKLSAPQAKATPAPAAPSADHVEEIELTSQPIPAPSSMPVAKLSPPPAQPVEKKITSKGTTPAQDVTPLPKAEPIKSQEQVEKHLPLARPEPAEKKPPARERKIARVKPGRVFQPPPINPEPPQLKESTRAEPEKSPIQSEPVVPPPAPNLSVPAESLPGSVPGVEPAPPAETMIHKQVSYRKQASARIKSISPENIIPPFTRPASSRAEKPLITPQKYRPAAQAKVQRQIDEPPPSGIPHPPRPQDAVESSEPVTQIPENPQQPETGGPLYPSAAATRPIPLALAYPSHRVEQNIPAEKTPPSALKPVAKIQKTSKSPSLITRSASPQNVVQRRWPENEGGPGPSTSGGGTAGEKSASEGAGSSMDLAQLAEDVFPYVKRLIEIEGDRLSSRFN